MAWIMVRSIMEFGAKRFLFANAAGTLGMLITLHRLNILVKKHSLPRYSY